MALLNFKEQVKKDISVFLNVNEFASKHVLSGKTVNLIIDEDELKQRKVKAAEGTYVGEIVILVEKLFFSKRPVEGKKLTLDNEVYYVLSCDTEGEFFKIALGKNDAY